MEPEIKYLQIPNFIPIRFLFDSYKSLQIGDSVRCKCIQSIRSYPIYIGKSNQKYIDVFKNIKALTTDHLTFTCSICYHYKYKNKE